MNSVKVLLTVGLLTGLLLLTATGCCDKEKKMIAGLTKDNDDLRMDNDSLRFKLAQAEADNDPLNAAILERDRLIASQNDEITKLKSQSGGVTVAKSADGWQSGRVGDMATLSSDILFSSGKADLTAKGKAALNTIITELKGRYSGMPVRVYGHTDSDPIVKTKHLWRDNLDLSANRAMAVTRHLVAGGVNAKLIETIGMGKLVPAGTKDRSRRVEIFVVKNPQ